MYAVMFYVILAALPARQKCYSWRAGASLPSRPNGAIFLFYPALMYAVMFYVILNKRKLHKLPLAKNVMHSPGIFVFVCCLLHHLPVILCMLVDYITRTFHTPLYNTSIRAGVSAAYAYLELRRTLRHTSTPDYNTEKSCQLYD